MQLLCLEESAESLRLRSCKFYKGCRKYTYVTFSFIPHLNFPLFFLNLHYLLTFHREGLGESYDGDIAFISSLDSFGGGHTDPHFVALGGKPLTSF